MIKKLFLLALFSFHLITISSQEFEIYISDAGAFSTPPWQILKYDENGENPEIFINEQLGWPQDIVFLEDQEVVLISNLNTGKITKYSSLTGTYIEDFATGISGPTRMKIGEDNLLYVLQWSGNGRVLRFQLDGTPSTDFTTLAISQSIGLDWDSTGNLYVSSYDDSTITKFDSSGNSLGVFISSNLNGPTNIWFDENDNLFVLNWNNPSNISRFDSDGNFIEIIASTGLSQCEGIDFLPNGNFLIGNGGSAEVKQFHTDGTFVENTISSGLGGLIRPNAIVVRLIPPLSISEDELTDNGIVSSTIGRRFLINESIINNYKKINLYNYDGKFIKTIKLSPERNQFLDTSVLADGIYVLVVSLSNKKIVQKIVVKH